MIERTYLIDGAVVITLALTFAILVWRRRRHDRVMKAMAPPTDWTVTWIDIPERDR